MRKISAIGDWLWEREQRHRARPLWRRILANIGGYLFAMLVLYQVLVFHSYVWAYTPGPDDPPSPCPPRICPTPPPPPPPPCPRPLC